jgi:hypothetical protein
MEPFRKAPRSPLFAALVLLLGGALAVPGRAQEASRGFEDDFVDRTMRVDYFHTGGVGVEIVSLDRVVSDGAWAGSRTRLIDDTGLGLYRFEVRDAETGRALYTRGFASIFGEWETTGEARAVHRTFHESVRFPWPRRPVVVSLEKRDGTGGFREVWSTDVEPDSRFVNTADPTPVGTLIPLLESGSPHEKVDVVLVGEGYAVDELPKFRADAQRLLARLFDTEPFRSRRDDFNVRALHLPSAASGVTRPRAAEFRRTPLSAEYNIFDSERYLLTYDNRALREALAAVPYEFVEILVNEKQYGGGGIFNAQATVAVDTEFADYIFIHEFGHHFAALADEYYTSSVAYETGGTEHPEPWEPNVTALHDPARLKWGDLVAPGTPLPTPWPKQAYEEHASEVRARRQALIDRGAPAEEFDALFVEQRAIERELLSALRGDGVVGAFEGAMYEARGLYRPEVDCIMFTRADFFCQVCRRAIQRIIDLYAS